MIEQTGRFNPWMQIWVKPTSTLKQVINDDSKRNLRILQFAGGIAYSFTNITIESIPIWTSLLVKLVLGFFIGYFVFHLLSTVLYEIGLFLNGQAKYEEVFKVVVWSSIPKIASMAFWVPLFIITGQSFNGITFPNTNGLLINSLAILKLLIEYWGLVILVLGLKQVQKFSMPKTLFNIFILPLTILIMVFVILRILG